MSVTTIGRLRELLEDLPDSTGLAIRIVVGGDLVTDDVAVVDLLRRTYAHGDPYVVLVPADDYDVAALVDDGLTYRAEQEERDRDTIRVGP